MMLTAETLKRVEDRFGRDAMPSTTFRDNSRLECGPSQVLELLAFLRNDCAMDMLVDVTAVDYQEYPGARDRYGVVYALANTSTGERVFVKVYLNDPSPRLPSVVSLWNGANWLEREVYDMFGIQFEGHPDLRRILLPDEFTAFPLRKDYPLRGRGERHNFPVVTRAES
jgi:NADH-quinone oxidoreductase subunit C